jgi:spore coat protein JC
MKCNLSIIEILNFYAIPTSTLYCLLLFIELSSMVVVVYDLLSPLPLTTNLNSSKFPHLVTDVGTEELGHLEMIGTIVHQLTRNLSEKEIEESGFAPYFVDHTVGVYPQSAGGSPWSAGSIQVTGDPIADINEDLAAEQKARVTYDNILRLVDDPDVIDPIRFLREREIVHYQRFGDTNRQPCKQNRTKTQK